MAHHPNSTDDVATMIATHTLATAIISRHNTPTAVLDGHELAMLKDFCADPTRKDAILAQHDMTDGPGQRPGARALATRGSLVGMLVARYGSGEPGFGEGEVGVLREWFEKGGGA